MSLGPVESAGDRRALVGWNNTGAECMCCPKRETIEKCIEETHLFCICLCVCWNFLGLCSGKWEGE